MEARTVPPREASNDGDRAPAEAVDLTYRLLLASRGGTVRASIHSAFVAMVTARKADVRKNAAVQRYQMAKGKNHGSVDLGLSVISTKGKGRRVDIDAEEFIYHLKVKNQAQFQQWVPQLRHHRLYRQHEIAFGSREAPKMTSPAVEDTSTVPTPGGNGYGSSSAACFDASLPNVDLEHCSEVQEEWRTGDRQVGE
ncbi:hypothetical protein HPB47_002032 [Ixodes persulcatus]|uniref:Uncharacterized protein n=1 Tax=Ixodes persulcatus TaxID=34615 RepID=A0AC60PP46_IXOPE|nr:hypothetical protein HPB47_002032 [Ixodes persulcatus]